MKTAADVVAEILLELDNLIELHDSARCRPEMIDGYRVLFRQVYELRELIELETGRRMLLRPLFAKGERPSR